MLRWARRIAIFLLLGAIVNVAVAWGCVFGDRTYWPDGRTLPTKKHLQWWRANAPEEFVRDADTVYLTFDIGYEVAAMYVEYRSHHQEVAWNAIHVKAGMPMRTMECEVWWGREGPDADLDHHRDEIRRGVWEIETHANTGPTDAHWVPLEPICIGFTVNTIIYGSVMWIFCRAPFSYRRWHRSRRGQCVACGYPRGTSPVCTECGEPLPTQAAK